MSGPGMAVFLCAIFLALFNAAQASTVNINSTVDVEVVATPEVVIDGFTGSLQVSCSFEKKQSSDFNYLISIILSKSLAPEHTSFVELATLSSQDPDHIQVTESLGALVTGKHVTGGRSHITFKWVYPSSKVEGQYKCEAFGIDDHGHPRVSSSVTEVQGGTLDVNQVILDKLRELTISQTGLQMQMVDLYGRMNDSLHSWSRLSFDYNDHSYYLSVGMPQNVGLAESQCKLYGGYLAELNDQQEFDTVIEFLKKHSITEYVCVGATDYGHDGVWTFMNSGAPVTYFKWASSNEGGTGSSEWYMFLLNGMMQDGPEIAGTILRFLCEIP